jgi:hypothetical protein
MEPLAGGLDRRDPNRTDTRPRRWQRESVDPDFGGEDRIKALPDHASENLLPKAEVLPWNGLAQHDLQRAIAPADKTRFLVSQLIFRADLYRREQFVTDLETPSAYEKGERLSV